ncbi:MAG TPA: hypothetical protein VGH23_03300 [Rhizomicrobium sp.]|jgi:hypothetical protein
MAKKPTEILSEIVELLTPLESEDRRRIFQAALMMLGETAHAPKGDTKNQSQMFTGGDADLPTKAQMWMQQNGLSSDMLHQCFHISAGETTFIAEPPGNNKKEKTLNAYIMAGIAGLLATGEGTFTDESARLLCMNAGCFDRSNHAAILKDKGNEFTGTKNTGWSLTAPGLKRAAAMIKEIAPAN